MIILALHSICGPGMESTFIGKQHKNGFHSGKLLPYSEEIDNCESVLL
jgi:hypothetical protein